MTTATAPGKIILFGEHAVVYGQPAIAVPVTQVQAKVDVDDSPRPGVWVHAPDVNLHEELSRLAPGHPLGEAIRSVFSALRVPPPSSADRKEVNGKGGLAITITSTIPVASGLGSGAAVSVALIRSLSAHLGHPLPDEQVSALTYEVEKIHHGTPSGIDNTVVTYAKPVYFVRGRDGEPPTIEVFPIARPFTIVIGDTGLPAPTKEAVADVRRLWEADRTRMERLFAAIGSIVRAARQAIEEGHPERLGPLMDENHALLQEMTVSSPELDRLVEAARRAGALGAKLSGGGRGGNMIALVEGGSASRVANALREAGAQRGIVTTVG
ncbi:MAG: mevalonate kinase [Anaerolineae bacterium]|nr:MAG: mevalonate kinase [Anaerolineae bacterium]